MTDEAVLCWRKEDTVQYEIVIAVLSGQTSPENVPHEPTQQLFLCLCLVPEWQNISWILFLLLKRQASHSTAAAAAEVKTLSFTEITNKFSSIFASKILPRFG